MEVSQNALNSDANMLLISTRNKIIYLKNKYKIKSSKSEQILINLGYDKILKKFVPFLDTV